MARAVMKKDVYSGNASEPSQATANLKTKPEVASYARVTTRTIDQWMQDGLLPYYKIGRRSVRFKLSDVEAHLNANCRIVNGASR